jgi:hypothetical protein
MVNGTTPAPLLCGAGGYAVPHPIPDQVEAR